MAAMVVRARNGSSKTVLAANSVGGSGWRFPDAQNGGWFGLDRLLDAIPMTD